MIAFSDLAPKYGRSSMLVAIIRRLLSSLALMSLLLPGFAIAASPTAPLASFPTAQEAQQHCGSDLSRLARPADADLSLPGPAVVRLD
jgi:hypothetical protein